MPLTELRARQQLRKTRPGATHEARPAGSKNARKARRHRIAVPHGLVSTLKAK